MARRFSAHAALLLLLLGTHAVATDITGAEVCTSAPTVTLGLSSSANETVVLTGFGAAKVLYLSVFVASLTTDTQPTSVAVTAQAYAGTKLSLAVQPSCPESGMQPTFLASNTALGLGEKMSLPLWPSGSFIFRVELLAQATSDTVLTLVFAEEEPSTEKKGSTCGEPLDLVDGRVVADGTSTSVSGDTSVAARLADACGSSLVRQSLWYALSVPTSSSGPTALVHARVVPVDSLVELRVDVFSAAGDCNSSSTATDGACSSSVVLADSVKRTAANGAWVLVRGDEYLVRVTSNDQVDVLAAGRFVLEVSSYDASTEDSRRCASASTNTLACGSQQVVLESSNGTASSDVASGGSCTASMERQPSGHWYVFHHANSDGRYVMATLSTESESASQWIDVYEHCGDLRSGTGCIATTGALSNDKKTCQVRWYSPSGSNQFRLFVRGVESSYKLVLAEEEEPSSGVLVVSPSVLSSSGVVSSPSSTPAVPSSSAASQPATSSSSSTSQPPTTSRRTKVLLAVAVSLCSVVFVALVVVLVCRLRNARRLRLATEEAAMMTSAFGDVLDTIDDDDDDFFRPDASIPMENLAPASSSAAAESSQAAGGAAIDILDDDASSDSSDVSLE